MKEQKEAGAPGKTLVRSEIASESLLSINGACESCLFHNATTQFRQLTLNSCHDNCIHEGELSNYDQGMYNGSSLGSKEGFDVKTTGQRSVHENKQQTETFEIETKTGHIHDDIYKSTGDRKQEIKYCQNQHSTLSMERSDSLNICCKTLKEDVNKKEKMKAYQNSQEHMQAKASKKFIPNYDAMEKMDSNKADESRTTDDEKAKYEKIIALVVDKPKEGKIYETQLRKQQDIVNKDSEDMDNKDREEYESRGEEVNNDDETSIKSESDPMNQKVQEEEQPLLLDTPNTMDNEASLSIDGEETGRYKSIIENSWSSMVSNETRLDVTENSWNSLVSSQNPQDLTEKSWYPEASESLYKWDNGLMTFTETERKDFFNCHQYILRKMKEDPTQNFENLTCKGSILYPSMKVQAVLSAMFGHHPDEQNKPSNDTASETLSEIEVEIEKDFYEAKEKDKEFEEIGDEQEKQSFKDAREKEKEIKQALKEECEMLEQEQIKNDCTSSNDFLPDQVKVDCFGEEVFQGKTEGKGTEDLKGTDDLKVKEIEMSCKDELSYFGVEVEIDTTQTHETFETKDTEENINKDITIITKDNLMIYDCYEAAVCEVGKAEIKKHSDEFANTERRTKSKRTKKEPMHMEYLKVKMEMEIQLNGMKGLMSSLQERLNSYSNSSLSCQSNSYIKEYRTTRPPSLVKEMDCEIFSPKTRRGQRRLRILQFGGNGRKCSATSSDSGGSLNETSDPGKGSNQQGNKNEDQNNNHSDKGNDSNNRKNGRNPNDGEGPGRDGSPDPTLNQQRRTSTDGGKVPEQDYKRYRRKHSDISEEHWEKFLGYLKEKGKERGSPCWDLFPNPVATCLELCMEQTEDLSDDMLHCFVCLTTNSLLKHYSNCTSAYIQCDICTQIFSLLCCHVNECTKRNAIYNCSSVSCTIPLCFKIRITLTGSDISSHMMTLWFNIRKKLSRVIGDVEAVIEKKTVIRKNSGNPPLESIPENGVPSYAPSSRPGSRVFVRKTSNLNDVVEEKTDDNERQGEINDVVSDAVPLSSNEKVRRETFTSLPMGPPNAFERQFRSFEDRPVGIKGIGEVVYGTKNQLINVARYWDKGKKEYQDNGKLPIQYREEGVILAQFQHMLVIGEVRYQKDFQWIKDSALGNGMSGKCSLASDFNSEAKFCVKEIHIASYEMDEIALWTDLDHPYIVQLYGAIRLGERIYIFMEYIAGGCLTEAINHQMELGQRLSQATALRYFQQLLEVLVYLKTKNILHEDLKGDNILLHRVGSNVSIKVTDFGASRRCQGQVRKGTKPSGTETQWSPEKAEATGYSFPAELWAAVCVLVHMLSGSPPWIRRFGTFKTLILVIVGHSPPLEDIPRNISDSVRDLIERGFTVCPGMRPLPQTMLLHDAFRTLVNSPGNEIYSILGPGLQSMACIEDDLSKDLREIYRNLGGTSPDRKYGPFVQPSTTVQVFTARNENNGAYNQVGAVGGVSNQTANQMGAVGGAFDQESGAVGGVSNPGGGSGQGENPSPGDPSKNIDPTQHFENYLFDTPTPGLTDIPGSNLVEYQPVQTTGHEETFQRVISHDALDCVLPCFNIILGKDVMDEGYNFVDSEDEDEGDDIFKDFQLDVAIENLNISEEDDKNKKESISLKPDVMEKEKVKGISTSKYIPTLKDKQEDHEDRSSHLDSVNDDDLFGSGGFNSKFQDNAPQTSSSGVTQSYNHGISHLPNTQANVQGARSNQILNTNAENQGEHRPSRQVHSHDMSSLTQYNWLPGNPGQIYMIQSPQEIIQNNLRQAQSLQYGSQNSELHGNRGNPLGSSPIQHRQPQSAPYTHHIPNRNPVQQNQSGNPGQYNPIANSVHCKTQGVSPQYGQYTPSHTMSNNPQYRQGQLNHHTQLPSGTHQYPTGVNANQPRQSPGENSRILGTGTSEFQSQWAHQQRLSTGTSQAVQPHSFSGYPGQHQSHAVFDTGRYQLAGNPYFASHQHIQNNPHDGRKTYVPQEIIIVQPPSDPKHNLQLDVEKAKQGIPITSREAQTAPVTSPKLTSPPYKRTTSYVTPKQQRHSVSSTSAGSRSTKSLLEEQERALEMLKDTAKDALSQHEGSHVDLLEEDDVDPGLEVTGELDVTGDLSDHDWQSMAVYLQENETDRRIQVTIKRQGDIEGESFKMSFSRSSQGISWESIIDDELSRHTNELSAGLDRFCLKLEDGTLVDLNSSLGEEDIVVYVQPADERDGWWVEQSMIMKSNRP